MVCQVAQLRFLGRLHLHSWPPAFTATLSSAAYLRGREQCPSCPSFPYGHTICLPLPCSYPLPQIVALNYSQGETLLSLQAFTRAAGGDPRSSTDLINAGKTDPFEQKLHVVFSFCMLQQLYKEAEEGSNPLHRGSQLRGYQGW